jgi:GntR family transcriptional regulator
VSIGPVKASSLSLPRRVADALREAIQSGEIAAGERLPMETQLAERLGVSRATLRDGLRILEAEGLVARRGGVGMFATTLVKPVRSGIERLDGVADPIRRAGYTPGSRDLRLRTEPAEADVADALAVDAGTPVMHLSRPYPADEHPVIRCEELVAEQLLPRSAEPESFRGEISLADLLRARCEIEIVGAVATIIPVLPDALLARRLEVAAHQPLLLLEQVRYAADGRPVLFSRNTHESRAMQLQVLRLRGW